MHSTRTVDAFIVLGVVVVAIVLFSIETIPVEVTSLTVVTMLAITGVLAPAEAFSGFSNPTVIFIFALLVLTRGLTSTGLIELIGQRLSLIAKYGPKVFLTVLMSLVAAFSSIVSNTVTTAAFLPVASGVAERAKIAKSKVLLPLAYASMLGGTVLLYGTSTNLVMSAAMEKAGLEPIGVTELSPIGILIAIVGVIFVVLLGPILLPKREEASGDASLSTREYLSEAVLPEDSPYLGKELEQISKGLGIRVLGIERDGKVLDAHPSQELTTEDRIIVEGERADLVQINHLKGIDLKAEANLADEKETDDTMLAEVWVPPGSPFVGRALKDLHFHERFGLIVLGIHRRPMLRRVLKMQLLRRHHGATSLSTLILEAGDVLLVRGTKERLAGITREGYLSVLTDIEHDPPRYSKAIIALTIFLTALGLATFDILDPAVAGIAGVLAMLATGCTDARRAFSVEWRVLVVIGSMMALGVAMEKSGAGSMIGEWVAPIADWGGPAALLMALSVVTVILSAPMSNQAAGLVLLPVAISAAGKLGLDPRPFAIGITLAASCSFMTPLEPSCVLVYGPGRYKFTDFFRLGTPLTVALLALLAVSVPVLWPFEPAANAQGQRNAPRISSAIDSADSQMPPPNSTARLQPSSALQSEERTQKPPRENGS